MKRRAILMAVGLTAPTMAPAQFVRPGPPAEAIKSFSQNPDRRGSAWRDSAAPFIGSETRKIERGIRAGEKSGDITAEEARAFRRELAGIRSAQWRSGAPGAMPSGAVEVRARLDALRSMVHARRVRGGKP